MAANQTLLAVCVVEAVQPTGPPVAAEMAAQESSEPVPPDVPSRCCCCCALRSALPFTSCDFCAAVSPVCSCSLPPTLSPSPENPLHVCVCVSLSRDSRRGIARRVYAALVCALKQGVQMIKTVFALMHGATVDDVRLKWKVTKPDKPFPNRLRRAMVLAMAEMSFLQLSDWFPCTGLAKVIFRSCNLPLEAKKRVTEESARRKLLLLHACVCRSRYPETDALFPAWNEVYGVALREVGTASCCVTC